MKFLSILSLLPLMVAPCSAFIQPMQRNPQQSLLVRQVASKSLPFLEAPAKLDGTMVGDVGFDPIGISDQLADLKYVRAAELKHGRVAMLAFLGWVVQQFIQLPGEMHAQINPFKAVASVPLAAHAQILGFCAIIELASIDDLYTSDKPWDLGFDPMNFSKNKSPAEMEKLQLQELKNGRLAMIAMIGLFTQTAIFGNPLF